MWQSMPVTCKPGSGDAYARQARRLGVKRPRFLEGDAELVFLQPRGDVGVGAGIDVRVHAQADGRRGAHAAGDAGDAQQFAARLDVEAEDALLDGQADVRLGLAHAREHHLARVAPSGDHALQLAARDDVEAAAQAGEQVEDGEVGVCLHSVADEVRPIAQRPLEGLEGPGERRFGVDVAGGAELAGDGGQGYLLGVQFAVDQAEWAHFFSLVSVLSGAGAAAGALGCGR
jgi:hypothetical protein